MRALQLIAVSNACARRSTFFPPRPWQKRQLSCAWRSSILTARESSAIKPIPAHLERCLRARGLSVTRERRHQWRPTEGIEPFGRFRAERDPRVVIPCSRVATTCQGRADRTSEFKAGCCARASGGHARTACSRLPHHPDGVHRTPTAIECGSVHLRLRSPARFVR